MSRKPFLITEIKKMFERPASLIIPSMAGSDRIAVIEIIEAIIERKQAKIASLISPA